MLEICTTLYEIAKNKIDSQNRLQWSITWIFNDPQFMVDPLLKFISGVQ